MLANTVAVKKARHNMKRKTIMFWFLHFSQKNCFNFNFACFLRAFAAVSEKPGIRCTDATSSGRIWGIFFDDLNLEFSHN
jgi:hypothetical protein